MNVEDFVAHVVAAFVGSGLLHASWRAAVELRLARLERVVRPDLVERPTP